MVRASRFLVAICAALTLAAPASARQAAGARIAGDWHGSVRMPGAAAPLAFDIRLVQSPRGWTGSFSIPAERVVDMPLDRVEAAGDSVVLTLRQPGGAPLVVRGRIVGNSLNAVLHAGDARVQILFGRAGSRVAERVAAELRAALLAARTRPLAEHARGPALGRVDEAALDSLLRAAHAANSDAVVILHDGDLVGEWHAGDPDGRIEAMSVTKSVVNLAVGRLVTTGAIASLDAPVHEYFPEWSEGRHARVTLRHLLNHTSGLHADRTTEAIYASRDFVRHALHSSITSEPGTELFYNNSATNLLAAVVGVAAGRPMDEFLRHDLFARLGITGIEWARDAAGNPHGMAGLRIRPRDLARLGQLVLDRGVHDGERLIDEAFLDESLNEGSPLSAAVGLLWWLIREPRPAGEPAGPIIGWRADGYLGQYLVIYPAERIVAVRMVRSSPAYDAETDAFASFQALVRRLVPQS